MRKLDEPVILAAAEPQVQRAISHFRRGEAISVRCPPSFNADFTIDHRSCCCDVVL